MALVARFIFDESAMTAEKYGLIAACISLALATVVHGVGGKVKDTLIAAD